MSQANLQNEPTMDEILASIRKIISEDQSEPEKEKAEEVAESAEPQPVAAPAPDEVEASADDTLETNPVPVAAEPEVVAAVEAVEPPAHAPVLEEFEAVEEVVFESAPELDAESTGLAAIAETSEESDEDVTVQVDEGGETLGFPPLTDSLSEEYVVDTPEEDTLISASARNALDQVLGQLDDEPQPVAAAVVEGDSIEAVFTRAVQQSLEPTLQNWVEDNSDEILHRLSPLIRDWMDENLPPLIEAAVAKEISRAVRSRRR
jgi:cell pole-organizing protein PopZ